MNKLQMTFQEFLTTQSVQIPALSFSFNLLLAALLGYLLGIVYIRYGRALSNRRSFSANFIVLAMTTTLIISVVKSSLALSLGLVGALSIIRFRAAIKEPEELAYVFLTIALGLGLGADQAVITVIAFLIIVAIVIFRGRRTGKEDYQNLILTISAHNPGKIGLEEIVEKLKMHCKAVNLKRLNETGDLIEAAFLVEFENYEQFERSRNELIRMNDSVHINFLDNKGVI